MIEHNYLQHKVPDCDEILAKIKRVVESGEFTLGSEVEKFEHEFAQYIGVPHAISVASGTDALFLSLKALDIGPGDEVITSVYTFFATIGAIVATGAKPVLADVGEDYNINFPDGLRKLVNKIPRAVIPVHWAGRPATLDYKGMPVPVIEDACQAIGAFAGGVKCGAMGTLGCFSLHPLKNLHVWGDGGVITTSDAGLAGKLRLMRNHGLADRDTWLQCAYNSRLDAVQAVVARHYLARTDDVLAKRNTNAFQYAMLLRDVPQIKFPPAVEGVQSSNHLFILRAERRDQLYQYLKSHGVDAKIHYPQALHLQPAMAEYGYKRGDFPVYEKLLEEVISLPIHEYLTTDEIDSVCETITEFYK